MNEQNTAIMELLQEQLSYSYDRSKILEALPPEGTYYMDAVEFLCQFPDEYFDIVITDEPYGVQKTAMNIGAGGKPYQYLKNAEWEDGVASHMKIPWIQESARVLKEGGWFINFGALNWVTTMKMIAEEYGLSIQNVIPSLRLYGRSITQRNYSAAVETINIYKKGKGQFFNHEGLNSRNWKMQTICPFCGETHPIVVDGASAPKWVSLYNERLGYIPEWQVHQVKVAPSNPHKKTNITQKTDAQIAEVIASHVDVDRVNSGELTPFRAVDPFGGSHTIMFVAKMMCPDVEFYSCDTDYTQYMAGLRVMDIIQNTI